MQLNEEQLIERMWIEFSRGKVVTNSVCTDFFFTMVRPDRHFSHINAFEVLDTVVNCDLPIGHEQPGVRKRLPLPTVEVIEEPTVEITIETPSVPDLV